YLKYNKRSIGSFYEEKAVYEYVDERYDDSLSDFKKSLEYYSRIKYSLKNYEDVMENWYELLAESIRKNNNSKEVLDYLFDLDKHSKIWVGKLHSMTTFSQFSNPLIYSFILLEKYPDNIELLRETALIACHLDSDYSIKCNKKILEIKPEDDDAIYNLLNLYKNYYLKDESLRLIDSKLYIDKLKNDLLLKKIELVESMTLFDEALDTYDEYLSIKKPDGLAYHKKTIFDKIRCMEQEATDYYLEGKLDKAFTIFNDVYETFKNIERNSYRIRTEEWSLEEWYVDVLSKSIDKSKDNPEEFFNEFYKLTQENIPLWISKINSLINWNNFGNPIQLCNILLNYNPNNLQILLAKANAYYRTRRISKALDGYEDILKQAPDNSEALNRKFNLLVRHHKYRQAYVLLNSIIIDYNEIRSDLEDLADALLGYGKYRQALNCYEIMMDNNHYIKVLKKVKLIWDKLDDTESQKNSKFYLDWIDTIDYKHIKNKCPECGGSLIPIIYGYGLLPRDKEFYPGGCCVGDDSPTDYCRKCNKEVNMGVYGIDLNDEDYSLYSYTRDIIIWFTKYLENYPDKTIKQLEKESYKMFSLDKTEFMEFIKRLKEIGYITIDKNRIKIVDGYKDFHTLFV
ncbi:MAG: hypothetical protein Q4Q22_02785, partial [Methanosphaera sp.]|nr:hypothetical protein [Methanosphaera sp.]